MSQRSQSPHGPAVRVVCAIVLGTAIAGCSRTAPAPAPAPASPPRDSEHAGITEPHGDHTPHHGGVVLMNGDIHYEVVLDPGGRHGVWFTNAVRDDLPASVASNVRIVVSRPGAAPEALALEIDESGESWLARGKPVSGDFVMVKVTYDLRGVPHEVDVPFIPGGSPPSSR